MKKVNNNRGIVMVAVLTLMFVAAVLSVALFTYANEQLLQSRRNQNRAQAEYLSRTGVEATLTAYNQINTALTEGGTVDKPKVFTTTTTYLVERVVAGVTEQCYEFKADVLPTDKILGYYDVTVTFPVEETVGSATIKTVSFECTATAGGTTELPSGSSTTPTNTGGASYTSEGYMAASTAGAESAYDLGWYNASGTAITTTASDVTRYADKISINGDSYDFIVYSNDGVVEIDAPSDGVYFNLNTTSDANNNNKVGFLAQILYVNTRLNLMPSSSPIHQVVVLSAGDIVINQQVDLNIYEGFPSFSWGSGFSIPYHGSTLLLNVPDVLTVEDPYSPLASGTEKCGKVYFNADVVLKATHMLFTKSITLFESGEAYYFKEDCLNGAESIDLVKYWYDVLYGTPDFPAEDYEWVAELIADAYGAEDSSYNATKYVDTDMRLISTDNGDAVADALPPTTVDSSYLVWK